MRTLKIGAGIAVGLVGVWALAILAAVALSGVVL